MQLVLSTWKLKPPSSKTEGELAERCVTKFEKSDMKRWIWLWGEVDYSNDKGGGSREVRSNVFK